MEAITVKQLKAAEKMGYFDDFQVLNVTRVRMYGPSAAEMVLTPHHYLGIMQGSLLLSSGAVTETPFIYFTPAGINTPNGWHSPAGRFRDNFYIECSGARADRLFAAFGAADRCRHCFVEDTQIFLALFNRIQMEFAAGKPGASANMALCIEEFAALLEQALRFSGNSSGKGAAIARIMEQITRDPGRQWDFRSEAEKLGITLRHWNRLFSAAAMMAPHRFVALSRLKLARELLVSSDMPIKQIAAAAGFEAPSEFSRFFKRESGQTPGQCRKTRLR